MVPNQTAPARHGLAGSLGTAAAAGESGGEASEGGGAGGATTGGAGGASPSPKSARQGSLVTGSRATVGAAAHLSGLARAVHIEEDVAKRERTAQ